MPFWNSGARHPQRIAMNDFMKALNLWEDNQRRSSIRAPIVTAQPMPPLSCDAATYSVAMGATFSILPIRIISPFSM
jgi:hypothetical protein